MASVGFWPVAKSVLLFLGVPLVAGVLLRYGLIAVRSRPWFEGVVTPWISPVALLGLLYTVVVLFAVQVANSSVLCNVLCNVLCPVLCNVLCKWGLHNRIHMYPSCLPPPESSPAAAALTPNPKLLLLLCAIICMPCPDR